MSAVERWRAAKDIGTLAKIFARGKAIEAGGPDDLFVTLSISVQGRGRVFAWNDTVSVSGRNADEVVRLMDIISGRHKDSDIEDIFKTSKNFSEAWEKYEDLLAEEE